MGKDSFYWWMGVVEDRNDPVMLGRLRVRILGAHTENKQLIPTCELQWAYVYQPITWNQAMNGLGHSPTGPAEGTWVWGFFKDNESAQDPVVLGTIAGIPEEQPQPCIGFYDPSTPFHDLQNAPRKTRIRYYPNDGTGAQNTNESQASLYPRQTHPWGCIIGESDVNRLARAENISDTIIGVRQRQRAVGVPIAFAHTTPGRQFNEPLPGYDSAYPYNHVYESESGHILEVDDTPNAERIHIYHRSGTYIEIGTGQEDNPGLSGDFGMKIVGKTFEIHMENSYIQHQNTLNVTVRGEVNFYCQDTINVQADGDMNVHVQGDYTEKIGGDYFTDIGGKRIVRIAESEELDVGEGRTTNIGNGETVNIGDGRTTKIGNGETLHIGDSRTTNIGDSDSLSAGGSYDVKIGGSYSESAATIEMNADGEIESSAGGQFGVTASAIVGGAGGWTWLANAIVTPSGSPHPGSPHSPSSPSSPGSPSAPVIPPFPDPTGIIETRNETGPEPVKETQPDVNPTTCPNQSDC